MKRAIAAIAAVAATTGFAVASMGAAAGAEGTAAECSNEAYGQSGIFLWLANGSSAHDTGLVVPGPAAGETLTVISSSWTTYDYLAYESSPSRAEQNEQNERVGLAVGGTVVGGLSTDLPDNMSQGAPDDWNSGVVSGSFGGAGGAVAGGSISLRHASLAGCGESANIFTVKSFSLTLQRCVVPQVTTTTAPATTTTAPATTTTAPGATTTAPAVTTTSVSAGAPTTTATLTGSAGVTTTVASSALPVTGGAMTVPLLLAALAGLTGTALLVVRRRPS
ncbi:MAG: LPXTG cell wall anchor domain-containing protein [Actinomycetota bacterium]